MGDGWIRWLQSQLCHASDGLRLSSTFVYLECLWNVELLEENLNEFLWRLICYENISFYKETFLSDQYVCLQQNNKGKTNVVSFFSLSIFWVQKEGSMWYSHNIKFRITFTHFTYVINKFTPKFIFTRARWEYCFKDCSASDIFYSKVTGKNTTN